MNVMPDRPALPRGVTVELPDAEAVLLTDLLIDFSGTLARDGVILPGVLEALAHLATVLRITVASADTFNRAVEALDGLPISLRLVECGEQKARIVEELGPSQVVAVGNGRNDVPMCRAAALSVAVLGPEGVAAELLEVADVLAPDIHVALDLLLRPQRLRATLRS